MMAQCPTVAGKRPESLFEDILSFFRVAEVIDSTGPGANLNHLKFQVHR